jgi:hypothetical protein
MVIYQALYLLTMCLTYNIKNIQIIGGEFHISLQQIHLLQVITLIFILTELMQVVIINIIYGSQLEAGSYATSLIHTSGSAVTRSADAANNAGNSDLFNDSEGVLYLESSALVNDDVNRFIQIHDGTYNNAITLYYSTTENQIIARTWASGSSIVSLNKTLEDATEFHKFAFSYKSGAYKFYIDGRQVATDTNSNTPTGLNQLGFLQGPSGNNFYANTKSVMVFKEALTDLELEKLTGYNNHELYMNYYNRLSYLGLAEEYNVESDINNYIL